MAKKKRSGWSDTKGTKKWADLSYKQKIVRIAEYEKLLEASAARHVAPKPLNHDLGIMGWVNIMIVQKKTKNRF